MGSSGGGEGGEGSASGQVIYLQSISHHVLRIFVASFKAVSATAISLFVHIIIWRRYPLGTVPYASVATIAKYEVSTTLFLSRGLC